ncbi:MAG: hypothetical protein HN742_06015 [Lentisphaerae bacterium]|jgi:hypothetical protein|nr:hypothetical protein [Lentisphaerota bacterium]MBT4820717.1 hypothetical protein [Lentisphaerota bacterium]MBT5609646.1 hypothetical protein [Lentisphaerota bacterium]MBT7055246.1 hypothetical protein [Lentisphaerota bacterium]MBT7841406.1 hypothetical protein [Lentisphaerota bacterium]
MGTEQERISTRTRLVASVSGRSPAFHVLWSLACAALFSLRGRAEPTTRLVDDFEGADLAPWQISFSPEYYQGGAGRDGLSIVDDPERGKVLACRFSFDGTGKGGPIFVTRKLDPNPPRLDVQAVRFWAKLSAPIVHPEKGFLLRLRTSDTQHDNWQIQEILGRPFPVGEWVQVEVPTVFGNGVRNIWGSVFGSIRQMTFRLDDEEGRKGDAVLLIDGIEMDLREALAEGDFIPKPSPRPVNEHPRVLLITHRAAGHYGVEEAIAAVAPDATVDTFHYRGLHFEMFGFPESREGVLAYDAVIMLNVDPFIMTSAQCCWLADAVHSGTRLLLFGGSVTLNDARTFRGPLRELLPVTFESGAKPFRANAVPDPGELHALNLGLDPTGLGRVGRMQPLSVKPGATVPWSAGGKPLVIVGEAGSGRVTVVNAMAAAGGKGRGGLFTSTLSDDFMRSLARWSLQRMPEHPITALRIPREVSPGGAVEISLTAPGAVAGDVEVWLEDRVAVPVKALADGRFEATCPLPGVSAGETHVPFRVVRREGKTISDWRDLDVALKEPLRVDVAWERCRYTFAPGTPVALTASVRAEGLARVEAGSRTSVTLVDGWPVTIDSFADVWVKRDGVVYHNQAPAADVQVESRSGVCPSWLVTGVLKAARPGEGTQLGEDGRVARCRREIATCRDGAVEIRGTYTFVTDVDVHRMPLTLTFPTDAYAGLPFTVEQDGVSQNAILPAGATKGSLFDGNDCDLRIETPSGPVRVEVLTPDLRVWLRDLRQYKMPYFRLEIEPPCGEQHMKSGASYEIAIRVSSPGKGEATPPANGEINLTAVIEDPDTRYRWEVPVVDAQPGRTRFAGELPELASGEYVLQVVARVGDRTVSRAEERCFVVDPLVRDGFFPIMSLIGIQGDGHWLDEPGIRGRVDDLVDHGFNTLASTGPTTFFTSPPRDNGRRLKGYAESYAQQAGAAVFFEYTNFTTYRRKKPLTPCPFSADVVPAVRRKLTDRIDVGRRTPRLLTAKVVDEPTVSLKLLDQCEHCMSAFRERYGHDLPADVDPETPYLRWALADFMGTALSKVFEAGATVMEEEKPPFDLLLTYMATGLGYQSPLKHQQDALRWSRHVKWADFDIYPYFYPKSQRVRMVQAGFGMAAMRDIGRAHNIPWGFYVELDDRNWPFQKNPKEASAECAFTAVANGAGYLNTFIHRLVGTGTQARPERWDAAGKALRLIRRCGPMLTEMPAVRANVAVYFPDAQESIANGYDQPDYTFAFLKAGFGDTDIHRERVILENGTVPYTGLVMLRTEYLHADAVPILQRWLGSGGVLITDELPTRTHRDEPIEWGIPADLTVVAPVQDGGIGFSVTPVGQGRVIMLAEDIEKRLGTLAESKGSSVAELRHLRAALRDILDTCLSPNVRVDYVGSGSSVDTVEAGLRGGPDGAVLVVVNHRPEAMDVAVTLNRSSLRWFVDMASWDRVEVALAGDDSLVLNLTVPGRWGRVLAGYGLRPTGIVLELADRRLRPGENVEYRVRAKGGFRKVASGGVLIETTVIGPDGVRIARLGGKCAPLDGMAQLGGSIPLNAKPGRYEVLATLPQTGDKRRKTFTVE